MKLAGGPLIPRADIEIDPTIPAAYEYRTPDLDDYDEDGFGYFRGTWLIRDVPLSEATEISDDERRMLRVADKFSASSVDFDRLASALENADEGEVPDNVKLGNEWPELRRYISAFGPTMLGGLELGVSGLVHALASVGCWPAASCRGHPGERAWASQPVVYLAADRQRANVLQSCVAEAKCGLDVDPARPDLLVVIGGSISEMVDLATRILSQPDEFKLPNGPLSR